MHAQVGEADDGAGGKIYINKYEAEIAETEDEATYAASMAAPKIPVVIAESKKNMFGSPRGYKVQLNRPLLNLEPEGYDRSKALGECCWLLLWFRLYARQRHDLPCVCFSTPA